MSRFSRFAQANQFKCVENPGNPKRERGILRILKPAINSLHHQHFRRAACLKAQHLRASARDSSISRTSHQLVTPPTLPSNSSRESSTSKGLSQRWFDLFASGTSIAWARIRIRRTQFNSPASKGFFSFTNDAGTRRIVDGSRRSHPPRRGTRARAGSNSIGARGIPRRCARLRHAAQGDAECDRATGCLAPKRASIRFRKASVKWRHRVRRPIFIS